jgi:hypothetical protein
MTNITSIYVAVSTLLLLLVGTVPAAHAVDISCNCENGNVRLFVPGLYYEAYVERAESPDGPYAFIGHGSYGCTEACEFMDTAVVEGTTYWYQMTVIPQYGPLTHLGPAEVTTPALPSRMFGSIASPNPFSDIVSMRFRIPALLAAQGDLPVRVTILDASGRTVRGLSAGAMARGDRIVTWDGRDGDGRKVPTGIYLYAIEVGANREAGRIIKLN